MKYTWNFFWVNQMNVPVFLLKKFHWRDNHNKITMMDSSKTCRKCWFYLSKILVVVIFVPFCFDYACAFCFDFISEWIDALCSCVSSLIVSTVNLIDSRNSDKFFYSQRKTHATRKEKLGEFFLQQIQKASQSHHSHWTKRLAAVHVKGQDKKVCHWSWLQIV